MKNVEWFIGKIIILGTKKISIDTNNSFLPYRDIKPENILFDPIAYIPSSPHRRRGYGFDENKEDEGIFVKEVGGGGIGTVKLADFGLSKVIWDSVRNTE